MKWFEFNINASDGDVWSVVKCLSAYISVLVLCLFAVAQTTTATFLFQHVLKLIIWRVSEFEVP